MKIKGYGENKLLDSQVALGYLRQIWFFCSEMQNKRSIKYDDVVRKQSFKVGTQKHRKENSAAAK